MKNEDIILGIWDGHDAGVAFIQKEEILFATNEERYTRKKLEVGFPKESIKAGLENLKLSAKDIKYVAYVGADQAKTLTRVVPGIKDRYYNIRRKKVFPSRLTSLQKKFKYFYTEFSPNFLAKWISNIYIKRQLSKLNIKNKKLILVDHHTAHVYGAGMTSSFNDALVVSLDGIGDGLSGMVATFRDGKYEIIHKQFGRHSLGIFFEHVTNLLNMRELEDEGKVMALADFSIPIEDKNNPLMDFFKVQEGKLIAKYNSGKMYKELKRILWKFPFEQFAYMAQKTLEKHALEYVKHWIKDSNKKNIVLTGGIAANIKLNQKILELENVDDIFVFPHMGDGGLALGAALFILNTKYNIHNTNFRDCFLSKDYTDQEIEKILKEKKIKYQKVNPTTRGAEIIASGEILFWFQGSMEYGPRALGHRSILTLPGSEEVKNKLNLKVKKRVWYQPFCPSMTLEAAREVLKKIKGTPNEYMTCGYWVKDEYKDKLKAVINIDGSCRPQVVLDHNKVYYKIINEVKKRTGLGVVLNTSFNLHGEPIVNAPEDAIRVFELSDVKYMIMNNYLITKESKVI